MYAPGVATSPTSATWIQLRAKIARCSCSNTSGDVNARGSRFCPGSGTAKSSTCMGCLLGGLQRGDHLGLKRAARDAGEQVADARQRERAKRGQVDLAEPPREKSGHVVREHVMRDDGRIAPLDELAGRLRCAQVRFHD